MSSGLSVNIHPSLFPAAVRHDLLAALKARRVPSRCHYESLRQAQKWLDLHRAYAPSARDPDCGSAFAKAYRVVTGTFRASRVELVGLCCGDGSKEAEILAGLGQAGKAVVYRPCDGSLPLVLAAALAAAKVQPQETIHPQLCDFQNAEDLASFLAPAAGGRQSRRLVTFFGAVPNFSPRLVATRLADILRPGDQLLLSANLVPGRGSRQDWERLRQQYDNPLTREWLGLFLSDLGIPATAGQLQTVLEPCPEASGLRRISVYFRFSQPAEIRIYDECRRYRAGERLRLFFSYRYTPELLSGMLGKKGLSLAGQWLAQSGEEGVFWLRR